MSQVVELGAEREEPSSSARYKRKRTYNKGSRDHGETGGDGIEDDLLVGLPVVRGEAEQSEDSGDAEEGNGEPREGALKGSADVRAEEGANDVPHGESPSGDVSVPWSLAILVLADL